MIILSGPNKTVEVVLAGTVATTAMPWTANWVDVITATQEVFAFGATDGVITGATAVTVVQAPALSHTRTVKSMTFHNADTTGCQTTVRINNGISTRKMVNILLATGSTLEYIE